MDHDLRKNPLFRCHLTDSTQYDKVEQSRQRVRKC